jgi:glyoxylase-like metal-dependent hydrolase (beta-lactamase superfamily II)
MLEKRETAESLGFQNFSPRADALLHDGDSVKFGKCVLKVLDTPGHSPGSITLVREEEAFTGDTLFEGSIGRTDFPGSSPADMEKSLKKLKSLRDNFTVCSGHGSMTTMREEKQSNPFLQ